MIIQVNGMIVIERWEARRRYRDYCRAIDNLNAVLRREPYPDQLQLHVALAKANTMAELFHGCGEVL